MIVNKTNKGYQTRSDVSNFNWLKSDDWYVVQDNSQLANKIMQLYPRYEFVLDEEDNLIDVEPIPKTQEELGKERMQEIKVELNSLDIIINRATEDLYNLTNTAPYETTQNVINRKKELREELKTLTGGDLGAKNNANE